MSSLPVGTVKAEGMRTISAPRLVGVIVKAAIADDDDNGNDENEEEHCDDGVILLLLLYDFTNVGESFNCVVMTILLSISARVHFVT